MKYVEIPHSVFAFQWTGFNSRDAKEFCEENELPRFKVGSLSGKAGLVVKSGDYVEVAEEFDYVLKNHLGECSVKTKEEFEANFLKVPDFKRVAKKITIKGDLV